MRWTKSEQREHDEIVHQLRAEGWGKDDAVEQADILMSERIERRTRTPVATKEGK